MLVAFWGIAPGQVANTANMLAVANFIAIESKGSVLISDIKLRNSPLKNAFSALRNDPSVRKAFGGMSEIERLAVSHRLLPEHVRNNAEKILDGRLHMMFGADLMSDERLLAALPKIFEACREYSLSFIDVGSDISSPVAQMAIEKADLVVVSISQNINIIEPFFREGLPDQIRGKEIVYCLGMFDRVAGLSPYKISAKFNIPKGKIGFIPYNTEYRNSLNSLNAPDFLLRASSAKKVMFDHNENVYFAEASRNMVNLIGKSLSLDLEREED